jgi:hypothetical protein
MICWILVLGSGLYLYRAKHEVEVLDKHIVQLAKDTEILRADSRHFLDEWIRLGEPEQLRKYSDQYLGLKTVQPTQFVRVSDLSGRLPAPRLIPPADLSEAMNNPLGITLAGINPLGINPPGADPGVGDTDEADADGMPVPPIPPTFPSVIPAVAVSAVMPAVTLPVASHGAPDEPKPNVSAGSRIADDPRGAAVKLLAAKPMGAARPGTEPRLADEPRVIAMKPEGMRPEGMKPEAMKPGTIRSGTMKSGTIKSGTAMPVAMNPGESRLPEVRVGTGRGGEGHGDLAHAVVVRPGEPHLTMEPRAPEPRHAGPGAIDPKITDAHPADPRRDTKPAHPAEPHRQTVQGPRPQAGSLLGMTRGTASLPAPTPVSASWPGR